MNLLDEEDFLLVVVVGVGFVFVKGDWVFVVLVGEFFGVFIFVVVVVVCFVVLLRGIMEIVRG